MTQNCWLAKHGLIEVAFGKLVPVSEAKPDLRDCMAPRDPTHLIPKRQIKFSFPRGVYKRWGQDKWDLICGGVDVRPADSVRTVVDLVSDPRIIVAACRRHHHLFDIARKLRIPREALPVGVEEFAYDYGLAWWLDKEYGARREAGMIIKKPHATCPDAEKWRKR